MEFVHRVYRDTSWRGTAIHRGYRSGLYIEGQKVKQRRERVNIRLSAVGLAA